MENKKLFFFGDSICFGQGVAIHKGWVPRISAILEDLEGMKVDVINTAVNGNTTRQALERMPYEIQSHNPDVMVVQFGMNDCNYWETDKGLPRVSKKAFVANMEEIVTRGLQFGAKFIMVNTNHPTTRNNVQLPHTRICYQESNEEYNEALRKTFADYGDIVVLNDIETEFNKAVNGQQDLAKMLLADGLHLSEAGHDLYFSIVSGVLTNHLKRFLV